MRLLLLSPLLLGGCRTIMSRTSDSELFATSSSVTPALVGQRLAHALPGGAGAVCPRSRLRGQPEAIEVPGLGGSRRPHGLLTRPLPRRLEAGSQEAPDGRGRGIPPSRVALDRLEVERGAVAAPDAVAGPPHRAEYRDRDAGLSQSDPQGNGALGEEPVDGGGPQVNVCVHVEDTETAPGARLHSYTNKLFRIGTDLYYAGIGIRLISHLQVAYGLAARVATVLASPSGLSALLLPILAACVADPGEPSTSPARMSVTVRERQVSEFVTWWLLQIDDMRTQFEKDLEARSIEISAILGTLEPLDSREIFKDPLDAIGDTGLVLSDLLTTYRVMDFVLDTELQWELGRMRLNALLSEARLNIPLTREQSEDLESRLDQLDRMVREFSKQWRAEIASATHR